MTAKEQAIADELSAVLKKHDMAGACFFCDGNSGHYVYEFSPTWSCMSFDSDKELRFRAMRAEFSSVEDQAKAITESANILFFLMHVGGRMVKDCENLLGLISKKFHLGSILKDR